MTGEHIVILEQSAPAVTNHEVAGTNLNDLLCVVAVTVSVCICFNNNLVLIQLNYTSVLSKIVSAIDVNSICGGEGFSFVSQKITCIELGDYALLSYAWSKI
jgi:hypothetical protein